MAQAWLRRIAASIFISGLLAGGSPLGALAQKANDPAAALETRFRQLYAQGKYADAIPIAQQMLALDERRLGKEHPDTLTDVNNLAELYRIQGRYGEAEPLYKRALQAFERLYGKDNPKTLTVLNNLAGLYGDKGRYAQAEPLYTRVLAVYERTRGPQHPDTLGAVQNLASLYHGQGRYAEAEPLFKRAVEGFERALGPDHPSTLVSVNNLAGLYEAQGRYAEAEPLYKRALEARERVLGTSHPDTLSSVNNLASLYKAQGRAVEAVRLFRRAYDGWEQQLGADHPQTLIGLNNLAGFYVELQLYNEAEPLYKHALEASERQLGKKHPQTLAFVNNLAFLYHRQGRFAEAEQHYKRVLEALRRQYGEEHPSTLRSLNNLAGLYGDQGRKAEAKVLYQRVLDIRERLLGAGHPDTLISAGNLAELDFELGDWAGAAELWRRSAGAIAVRIRLGAASADQALTDKRRVDTGLRSHFSRLIRAVYRLTPQGGTPSAGDASEMFETAQWVSSSEAAQSIAQMAARGAKGNPALAALVRERQDLVAEWQKRDAARNSALSQSPEERDSGAEAANLARLAAIDRRVGEIDTRFKAEFPGYALLSSPEPIAAVEVQSLLRADEALVLYLDTAALGPAPEETFIWVVTKSEIRWLRSDLGRAALNREVQALRCGLDAAAWDEAFCATLPGVAYSKADWEAGKPLPFDAARAHKLYKALLGGAEDLIADKHLLIVPSGALTQLPFQVLVQALPQNSTAGERIREVPLFGVQTGELSDQDRARLHWTGEDGVKVVKSVPGSPAETAGIKPDDIVLSAGGTKVRTPKQLVAAIRAFEAGAPVQIGLWHEGKNREFTVTLAGAKLREWQPLYLEGTDARALPWLIRDHALTVLPAVSSLKALRSVGRPSAAPYPMIGFGNPLLDGNPKSLDDLRDAQLAREFEFCLGTDWAHVTRVQVARRGIAQLAPQGGVEGVKLLRSQSPLPETAAELCSVAHDLGANPGEIRLGRRATERAVKQLSETGRLAQYRVVHFATHAALAGQFKNNSEPGLILTPPSEPDETDDGYLTASEIAELKLDADWVILSACNTAAGREEDAEALSGFARAYIYAGARAVLVSHWAVDSDATVKLISGAMRRLASDKTMGRAEAVRQSMLALIAKGEPYEAHPAYWAPFVVVGEGGPVK